MRRLILTEYEFPRPVDLTPDEAEALAGAELAVVTRSPGRTGWEVAAGKKVGVARIGDLQVTVRPKIAIDRLVFLMGYAQKPDFWRDHTVMLDADVDLVEALAESFRRLATKALEHGLLQGYRSVDEALPVVRGRIRVGDQISRQFGRGLPIEVTYDDFTVDIPENQLLLAATLLLLQLPMLSPRVRTSLQRLRLQLVDVTALCRGEVLPIWLPSRLNVRYQGALHLADLILAGDSFEQRIGDLEVSGFVFDMWKIYEDFVSIALREALAPYGGHSSLQARTYLDEAGRVEMRPDFLWHAPNGDVVVVDAKYKAEKPSGFPQADLYQLLAYCTVLGMPTGHLIYAKGNEEAAVHSVVGANVTIHTHTLDLAQESAAVLLQVQRMAKLLVTAPRVLPALNTPPQR